MDNMKALTICQPYAELILRGDKPVENRKWYCHYRGPLLIHAGKSRDWLGTWREEIPDLVFGAIVGIVTVVHCGKPHRVRAEFPTIAENEHIEGPYCIVLDAPRRLVEPIPYRGQQGLFNVPDEVMAGATYHAGSCQ